MIHYIPLSYPQVVLTLLQHLKLSFHINCEIARTAQSVLERSISVLIQYKNMEHQSILFSSRVFSRTKRISVTVTYDKFKADFLTCFFTFKADFPRAFFISSRFVCSSSGFSSRLFFPTFFITSYILTVSYSLLPFPLSSVVQLHSALSTQNFKVKGQRSHFCYHQRSIYISERSKVIVLHVAISVKGSSHHTSQ